MLAGGGTPEERGAAAFARRTPPAFVTSGAELSLIGYVVSAAFSLSLPCAPVSVCCVSSVAAPCVWYTDALFVAQKSGVYARAYLYVTSHGRPVRKGAKIHSNQLCIGWRELSLTNNYEMGVRIGWHTGTCALFNLHAVMVDI